MQFNIIDNSGHSVFWTDTQMETMILSEIISSANGVLVSMVNQMTGFEVFGNKITMSLAETAGSYLEYHTKTTLIIFNDDFYCWLEC